MGAGKTSVARALADRLGWTMRDSDADLERTQGRTVRAIRETRGATALHALEARHLLDALAEPGPSVVAAAASVVDDAACRAALGAAEIAVAWLQADPATLASRFGSADHRPAYGVDPTEFLSRQAAERYPLMAGLATIVVDAGAAAPRELAGQILAELTAGGWVEQDA
jgi:shikimate kinase